MPGVAGAGITTVNPLSGGTWVTPIEVEGEFPQDSSFAFSPTPARHPGLLPTLGTAVVAGRGFETQDGPGAPPVVLISARSRVDSGRRNAPSEAPSTAGRRQATVANRHGVVGDVGDAGDIVDTGYVPFAQKPDESGADELYVMVRAGAGTSAGSLPRPVRRAIARVDPSLAAYSVATMENVRREVLGRQRLGSLLIGLLALFGTAVALLGTYGVTTYRMERRRRDIGLRIALGAGPRRALRESLGEGLAPVAAGILAGALLTLIVSAALRRVLPGIQAVPLGAACALAAGLSAAAAAGLLAPALRLARLDPAATLRNS